MVDFSEKWITWLNIDKKWLPKLTESLKNIEIEGELQKMTWEEQLEYLLPTWIEKVTKLDKKVTKFAPGLYKKGHKLKISINADYQQYEFQEGTSLNEKGYKLEEENRPGLKQKPTKLPYKKMQYLIVILLILGVSLSIEELMELFKYNHKGNFRNSYIKPLEAAGFITKTNTDKPTVSNQKYLITEQGKRFLNGQDF